MLDSEVLPVDTRPHAGYRQERQDTQCGRGEARPPPRTLQPQPPQPQPPQPPQPPPEPFRPSEEIAGAGLGGRQNPCFVFLGGGQSINYGNYLLTKLSFFWFGDPHISMLQLTRLVNEVGFLCALT